MKMRLVYITLSFAIAAFFIVSCKRDTSVSPLSMGYNYFPNNVGHYVIYNCDSIVVNQLNLNGQPVDTFKYQLMEVIDSIYQDNSGRPTQRIVRYIRPDSTKPWALQKVWSGNLTTTTAERVEDNIRFVKLIFPVKLNAIWNGNGFNNLGEMDYQYQAVDVPYQIGNSHFDSTLTVLQDSNLNAVEHQFYLERYARNVGRINKVFINLTCSCIGNTNFIPQLATPNMVVTDSILKLLCSGSVIYTENYVSSGN